jgi:pyridoxamine 5'-phosphate oxidase
MTFHTELLPETLPQQPLRLLARWLEEATHARVQPNPNAMVLATADGEAVPSARVVLCKDLRPEPGYVTFFSNYNSRKGRELDANPRAAAVMHWDALRRQARLEGRITRATAAESEAYFASRAWQSRLSAWASLQSEPIDSRGAMEQAMEAAARRFGTPSPLQADAAAPDPGAVIARPAHWGGYHLWIEVLELWVEGAGRLHDRARWQRRLTPKDGGFEGGPWSATRLQP